MINYVTSHISLIFSINIIFLLCFIFLNISVPSFVSKKYNIDFNDNLKIIIINFLFFYIYLVFENNFGSDGISDYESHKNFFNELFCTEICFRSNLTKKIALIFFDLNIYYENSILLLNLLSCAALLLFYIKIKKFYIFKNFNLFLITFLLSCSGMIFWANSFLKENFLIFGITLFLFSINENKINFKLLTISLLICFLFRPFVGFFIFISLAIYYLLYLHLNKYKIRKIIYFFFLIIFIGMIIFMTKQYNLTIDFNLLTQIFNKLNLISNSYIDPIVAAGNLTYTNEKSFLTKIFYYYFYPLNNSSKLITIISIQNFFNIICISLAIFLAFLRFDLLIKFIKQLKFENIFLIYVLLYSLTIPISSYNSGIDLRQKWLSLLILLYLVFKFISYWFVNRKSH